MSILRPGGVGIARISLWTKAYVQKKVSSKGPALSELETLAFTSLCSILGSDWDLRGSVGIFRFCP